MARVTTMSVGGRRTRIADTFISPLEQRVIDGELTIDEANRIADAGFNQSSVTPGTLGQEVGTTTDIASDSGSNFTPNNAPTTPTGEAVTAAPTPPSTRPYLWKYQ